MVVPPKKKGAPVGILDLLRGEKTTDQVAISVATAEARRTELDGEVDALRTRRAALLLDDDAEAELDRIDHSLALAYRAIDRADAALGELQRRLTAGQEADRIAALDAAFARATAYQAKEKAALSRYSLAAARLVDCVIEAAAASALREAENAALRAGGDNREVRPAASLLAPGAGAWHEAGALIQRVRLPDAVSPLTDIFPNRQIGVTWDMVQRAIEKARQ